MVLVALTVLLLAGVVSYFVGAIKLAKYGFRLGTKVGWAVILFPPYTFYFAFKKLEVAGKEFPTALCSFGIILTVMISVAFFQPLSAMAVGDFEGAHDMLTAEIAPEREPMTDDEIIEALLRGDDDALEEDADAQERADELEEAAERRAEAQEELAEQEEDEEESDEDEDEDEVEEESDEDDD